MAVALEAEIPDILARFDISPPGEVRPYGGGHINASYRVRGGGIGDAGYLLQRLNPAAFRDSGAVMRNFARLTTHLAAAAREVGLPDADRRVVTLVPTRNGEPSVIAGDGACWRLLCFIPQTRMIERVRHPVEAREIGAAFGLFHRLTASYAGIPLEVVIPDFHDTARHVELFEDALRRNPAGRAGAIGAELDFLRSHRSVSCLLREAGLRWGIAHHDAKPANVLLDADSGAGLAVVDLDTVMPGTVLHDVGDLIRSASCSAAEDEPDLSRVRVEEGHFCSLISGFLLASGPATLDETERGLLVAAGLVITYEQGVRFLTDFVGGDRYYRITRSGQNLDRARVQFRLLASLEAMRSSLERSVAELVRAYR